MNPLRRHTITWPSLCAISIVIHGDTEKSRRRDNMTDGLELVEQAVVPESAASSEPVDDMLPRETVSKIVERERLKAFEKGKQEALMELQQQQDVPIQAPLQQPQQAQAPQQQAQTFGGMPQMTPEQVQKMIAEQAPQALQAHVQQLQQDQMVNSFVSKMQAAEQKYPGLEAELNRLNYNDPRMHSFIQLANGMENTGDIMKEVIDNPSKMESLLNAAFNQPYQAQKMLSSLSESIKTNQTALAQDAQARDPMSQLKPSTSAGMADSNAMSVNDLRKMLSRRK